MEQRAVAEPRSRLLGVSPVLVMILVAVLVAGMIALVTSSGGLSRLREDREVLLALLRNVSRAQGTYSADLWSRVADYASGSALRRIVPLEAELSALLRAVQVASVAARTAPDRPVHDVLDSLWALYIWYGDFIEDLEETQALLLWFYAFGLIAAIGSAAVSGRAVRRLTEERRRVQQLARRQLALFEIRQRSLMMELHDTVGQELAAVQFQLASVADGGSTNAVSTETLQRVSQTVQSVRDLVRSLARRLHPPELHYLGLDSALRELADDVNGAGPTTISVVTDEQVVLSIPASHRIHVFRVVQESVANALTHGHATRIVVEIRADDDTTWVSIDDDGSGFDTTDPASRRGLGLLTLAERANIIGGTLAVRSHPGDGTTVTLQIPNGE